MVIFGFGIIIVNGIFSSVGSGEITREVDQEVEQQIKILLDTGDRIVVYPEMMVTKKNNVVNFALGILNILELQDTTTFSVSVKCENYVEPNAVSYTDCPDTSSWTFSDYDPVNLLNNEEGTLSIPVVPKDAEQGTYIFDATVYYENIVTGDLGDYGVVKFRVVVE